MLELLRACMLLVVCVADCWLFVLVELIDNGSALDLFCFVLECGFTLDATLGVVFYGLL